MGEKRALAALWSIQGVGPVTLSALRSRFGSLEDLLHAPPRAWAPLCEWHGTALQQLLELRCLEERAEALEAQCRALRARILFAGDPAWPARLSEVPDAPPMLFAQGPGYEAPRRRRVAIVGSRQLEEPTLRRLHTMAAELARAGVGIVSGGALGCDQAAHSGALEAGGETWVVLGNALDQVDSPQRKLIDAVHDAGQTVFSQFPPGFRANANSFVQRNAVISGVADAVLVFRAGEKSGALHTAMFAKEQGRPVLAVPGNPWDEASKGSNGLLRAGAALVLTSHDVLEALGVTASLSPREVPAFDTTGVSAGARQVYEAMVGAMEFEELIARLPSLTPGKVSAALVELEVRGGVQHLGSRRYEKR